MFTKQVLTPFQCHVKLAQCSIGQVKMSQIGCSTNTMDDKSLSAPALTRLLKTRGDYEEQQATT